MNFHRFLAFLVGVVALVVSAHAYLSSTLWVGFPDGHVTALAQAQRKLAPIFVGPSVVLALYLFWLGLVAGRRQVKGRLSVAIFLYGLVLATAAAVNGYLRAHLDDGQGG